jgi:hypothetical protein
MGCSTDKVFDSKIQNMGSFKCDFTQDEIKIEPMMFNSDVDFAFENGGPITKQFIAALPEEWRSDSVFDSRVHMLMPGWFPAIPGWHHDDVPRAIIPPGRHFLTAGQPDYDNPRYLAEHIMGLVNGEVCPTKFVIGKCQMKKVPDGELIYRQWHVEVEQLISDSKVDVVEAKSGVLIGFDWQAFHTGQKAVKNGWRWFGRISRNTDRTKQTTNEIRRQVQVYLEFPMEGW